MRFQKPKGTQDLLPGKVEIWQFLEAKAHELCRRFNYREIRTPIFEMTELFLRSVGETTDIVEKEMYTFRDKADRSMTLRPEGTAGAVRAYVENKLFASVDLVKLYYIGPMFRYERPQAGRYRQFHQFGVEAIGSDDPALDAEVIAMGYRFYREVGLNDVRVEINSIGNAASRASYRKRLEDFLAPKLPSLCPDCQKRFLRNPLRVLDCKKDVELLQDVPSILDSLDEPSRRRFDEVRAYLDELAVPYAVNCRLVRGLDYYTHTAFEYKAGGIGAAADAVGGGGRYDGLVAEIGGEDRPAVGFGIGLERVVALLETRNVDVPVDRFPDVYLIAVGEQASRKLVSLLDAARAAGLSADRDYMGRSLKAQLKAADRSGAKIAAVLGEDELDRRQIQLKILATGEQYAVSLDRWIDEIKNRLSRLEHPEEGR
ncbi:MAG: histidine--tRNA ligase [Candidatus Reconcilbacillus cellulovorans]|uniref:Histidine--tRNA ligase n=1 Tax=Candidatus Reconcilbacillus cellulovorans TaxID=1906605 RepID=A0A2A6DZP8_9BACL|nr:MAG: histidine--tRNA ligase [Candidatus Reconcilbacillus cellulovorans]